MIRPYSDEIFPAQVSLRTANTRTTFQGGAITCTRVALVNAAECLAENSGLPEWADAEFSARFLWYASDRTNLTVESAVQTMKRVGLCPESLCPYQVKPEYPYEPIDLLEPPSEAAWVAAKACGIDFDVVRIADKFDVARALALGSPLLAVKVGGNLEHAFCISGYHQDKGLEILDSGIINEPYWMPWSYLGSTITQVYKIVNSTIPMRKRQDYVAPSPAVFKGGVLTIPYLTLLPKPDPHAWSVEPNYYTNVVVHFGSDIGPENVTVGDPDMTTMDCRWKPASDVYGTPHTLSLFAVDVGGTVYERVTVKGVVPQIITYDRQVT